MSNISTRSWIWAILRTTEYFVLVFYITMRCQLFLWLICDILRPIVNPCWEINKNNSRILHWISAGRIFLIFALLARRDYVKWNIQAVAVTRSLPLPRLKRNDGKEWSSFLVSRVRPLSQKKEEEEKERKRKIFLGIFQSGNLRTSTIGGCSWILARGTSGAKIHELERKDVNY